MWHRSLRFCQVFWALLCKKKWVWDFGCNNRVYLVAGFDYSLGKPYGLVVLIGVFGCFGGSEFLIVVFVLARICIGGILYWVFWVDHFIGCAIFSIWHRSPWNLPISLQLPQFLALNQDLIEENVPSITWKYYLGTVEDLPKPRQFEHSGPFCHLHSPDIIFICESKSPLFPDQNPFPRMGFPLLFQVPASGSKGGLVVACKLGIDAEPVTQNNHQISILIYSDPISNPWMVTFAHVPSIWHDCISFWLDIEHTGNRFWGHWLLIGDLNAILSSVEKYGGRRSLGSTSYNNFLDFVQSNGLIDLSYSSNPFTWNNERQGRENLWERLDRGLSNKDWVLLFPNAQISHLPASSSDHNPILLSTSGNTPHLPKPFKYEEFWTRDLSSHTVIYGAWQFNPNGSAAFSLCKKFKATKATLKIWNTLHFGNIQKNIKHLLEQIDSIQCAAPDPSSSAIEENLHLNFQ